MKKKLLLIAFLFLANFTVYSQVVSINPNHCLPGQNLMTTITLAGGAMTNSTPPSNSSGIYLQQGATIIYTNFGYQPQTLFYYFYDTGTSTFTWYDSTRAPFSVPANAPTGFYDVVLVSYEMPLLTPDTNRMVNGFYVEEPTGTISGMVYFDINQNGVRDLNDPPMQNQRIQFSPTNDIAFTNSLGEFSYFVDTGSYSTAYLPPVNVVQTSTPLTYSAVVPPSAGGQDFGAYSALYGYNHIAYLNRTRFRCLTNNYLYASIQNLGYVPTQDKVTIIVSSNLTFVSASTPPDFINGDTLTWLIPNFAANSSVGIGGSLIFSAPAAGQTITYQLIDSIFDLSGNYIDKRTDYYSYQVACSYDPNDKHVSPEGVMSQNYTPINAELTYLINFQNTGNDYAYDVYIFDTLDSDLDLSTFEVIASSHELNTQITSAGAVRFNFFNIMLPDSGLDEPGSHGWVLYKIRPNAGLPDPTEITNTSYIVFDFNYPIITNTTLNTMTALQYPQADFTTNDVSICETNCILFNNLSTSGTNYEWSFAGGVPATSNLASPGAICYSTAGVYDVTLISTNALGSDTLTQQAYVNVGTSPGIFSVIQSGDSLIAPQGYDSYQWYFNNVLIANDTLYFHVATQNGDYGVVVGNANGCQTGVNIPNFIIGVEDVSSVGTVEVFPNPSNGNFEIIFNSVKDQELQFAIFDKTGKLMTTKTIRTVAGAGNKIMFDNTELSSGVYTLKISNDLNIATRMIIINK